MNIAPADTFHLATSVHSMPAIEVENPTKEQRAFLKFALLANHFEDPFYKALDEVGPFLQCDHETYVLIEFWKGNGDAHRRYLAFLNANFHETIEYWKANDPDAVTRLCER